MRISELKEVDMKISFEDACVYLIADNDDISDAAKRMADDRAHNDNYIKNSCKMPTIGRLFDAKFEVFVARDMTYSELQAYFCLHTEHCDECQFRPVCDTKNRKRQCEIILSGKQVIE